MTLDQLKAEIAKRGFTPSGGSWEDDRTACAFSVQVYRNTYGHPVLTATYDKERRRVTVGRDSWVLS